MRIETILKNICDFKGFVFEDVKMVGDTRLEVAVRERVGTRPVCSRCGKPGPCYDHLGERTFEFIPFWGIRCFFKHKMRRVDCPACGVTVEKVPWGDGKSPLTSHFQAFLAGWAKLLSWKTVAEKFHSSWDAVRRAVEAVVAYGLARRELDGVGALGVDEIQWLKGHKYLTIVWQLDGKARRLLWVGKDRTIKAFTGFFKSMEKLRPGFSRDVKFVCSDMWKAYITVVRRRLPAAVHILDRFHVMQKFSKAVDKTRAEEARKLKAEGKEPVLKHSKWCFLKRRANLTSKEKGKLKGLLKMNLRVVKAYLLKEQFQLFWEYVSPAWAGKFLDAWCAMAKKSTIEPMAAVANTLEGHRELLLNWFRAKKQYNNGIVEGMNFKVNFLVRRSFGFRTYDVIETALYHQFGDLPEPKFTHSFW